MTTSAQPAEPGEALKPLQRYTPIIREYLGDGDGVGSASMEPDPSGEYVRLADHESRLAEAQGLIREVIPLLEKIDRQFLPMGKTSEDVCVLLQRAKQSLEVRG